MMRLGRRGRIWMKRSGYSEEIVSEQKRLYPEIVANIFHLFILLCTFY